MSELRDTKAKQYDAVVSGLRSEPCAFKRQCFRDGWDAAIAALPDMVKPLEWVGVEDDCFVSCELDGRSYELQVVDTLERPCDYLWVAVYRIGRWKSVDCSGPCSFVAAKAAVAKHRSSRLLSAFGVQGGEA